MDTIPKSRPIPHGQTRAVELLSAAPCRNRGVHTAWFMSLWGAQVVGIVKIHLQ
jgi:hypothetical protein